MQDLKTPSPDARHPQPWLGGVLTEEQEQAVKQEVEGLREKLLKAMDGLRKGKHNSGGADYGQASCGYCSLKSHFHKLSVDLARLEANFPFCYDADWAEGFITFWAEQLDR